MRMDRWSSWRSLDQDGDAVAVRRMSHDPFQRRRLRDSFTIFEHALDMQGERLLG